MLGKSEKKSNVVKLAEIKSVTIPMLTHFVVTEADSFIFTNTHMRNSSCHLYIVEIIYLPVAAYVIPNRDHLVQSN